MSVWANFFGLILCSWLAPEQVVQERDVQLQHFDELDRCPRLAMLNSPSKLNARGSLSLPYSAILR